METKHCFILWNYLVSLFQLWSRGGFNVTFESSSDSDYHTHKLQEGGDKSQAKSIVLQDEDHIEFFGNIITWFKYWFFRSIQFYQIFALS